MKLLPAALALVTASIAAIAQTTVPDNLVAEGLPPIRPELRRDVGRYLEFRTAGFLGWHPQRKEMLITTRFADTAQLHVVDHPGGDRRQLTFSAEPIASGRFQPRSGRYILYAQDSGGGEFYQLHRHDLEGADAGKSVLLTDGKSRNTGAKFARSGSRIAYSSTRRNGKDTDLWVMDPLHPEAAKMIHKAGGGGWSVADWSDDESRLLVGNYVSINESALYVLELATGKLVPVTGGETTKVAYTDPRFSKDGRSVYCTTDKDSEFQRLVRIDLATKAMTVLTQDIPWDVEFYELSPDGRTVAFVVNQDGSSVLRLLDLRTGKAKAAQPQLPLGVIGGLEWHENGRDLGFALAHANSPSDAYSFDTRTGVVTRWTRSETGGLDAAKFRVPTVERTRSFDGLTISAFVYRPDPTRFPGKRPVVINIHGGPESQSRPIFQGRNNYYLDELGMAFVFPNVRGSAGYGKTFLTLDNGFRREDPVKDIGAIIEWIKTQPDLDPSRIAVTGGSYGGYMTLAALTHYSDRLKCGVDIVGISNFVTFLENTQDYRRDLRRAEYGDERDPAMREHLQKISPTTRVKDIRVPLFVVQGKNDPRVPVTEAEQMVKAVRENGGACWYLMAKDEGHGFQKKKNADFQFLGTILFWREHLLGETVR